MMFRFYMFVCLLFLCIQSLLSDPSPVQYAVRGIIKEIPQEGNHIRIEHEAIANYMSAMTMPFNVKTRDAFAKFDVGDAITFTLYVTKNESWIDNLQPSKTEVTTKQSPSSPRPIHNAQALMIGDALPNYRFINQHEKAFELDDFRGRVLVLTFIYTRCPLPDFCPRMSIHFRTLYDMLSKDETSFDWHLLSITFDPNYDTPKVLRQYAEAYFYDPKKWSFATGDRDAVDALAAQFGLIFKRSPISLNDWDHNLRTILIDPKGKIQQIYIGNLWTPKTLMQDIKTTMKDHIKPAE